MTQQSGSPGGTTDAQSASEPAAAAVPAQATEPVDAEGIADTEVPSERASAAPAPRSARVRRHFRYTLPGAWVALVFACLSFTPSLLPRSGVFQGALCGITAAIGYGLGVAGAWVWREFADRPARPPRPRSWRVFAIVAAVTLVISFLLGQRWQGQIRDVMSAPDDTVVNLLLMPVVAGVLFVGIIAVGRALRSAYRWLANLLGRWVGRRAARVTGWIVVVAVTVLLVNGVLLDGAVSAANSAFSVRNDITPEGVEQPTSDLRSGGTDSVVTWDSLGREGRKFVATGPTAEQISAFTGETASEPIRAFAGTLSADEIEDRAELAVADLERMGGFDRSYLLVATSTGSGWLDPSSVDTFEYLTGGDSAIIGMQYSYLPSWISFLVDQTKAREAGRQLFDAVYDRWSKLPAEDRPELLVFGESLGSFGGETAFSGEYDMANRTQGVLFAGPPNFNTLYREFTDDRDSGTPEVEPVYREGRIVRFTGTPGEGIDPEGTPWPGTRVLYLVNPSDPIIWWSPGLLLNRPDWLEEPRGHDVLDEMVWLPFVTFWQVTADLPLATAVPAGHGHSYGTENVNGWATVLQPEGWTDAQADRLQEIIAESS